MPTTYRRVLVTRTPEVDDLLERGREQLGVGDTFPASAVLVRLAERGLRSDGSSELLIRRASGHTITSQMVQDALNDD